jgi:hypothetical protein
VAQCEVEAIAQKLALRIQTGLLVSVGQGTKP